MANVSSFALGRMEIRHILISFNVSEKNIENLLSNLEKAHRHINVVTFIAMLDRVGLDRDKVTEVLRRFGIDDVTISRSMEAVDENRIMSETGRIYNVTIEF